MSLDKPKRKVRRGRPNTRSRKVKSDATFVIQEHLSKNRHWDLRFRTDGMMMSFALPKGPSLNPKKSRLAIKMPDHTLKYGDFEGQIAEGLYGAGKVIQWDKGIYQVEGDLKD